MIPDNIAQLLAEGVPPPYIDPVGTNYKDALDQAERIGIMQPRHATTAVLLALITKIQEQQKQIEMFEYSQRWRKRRP